MNKKFNYNWFFFSLFIIMSVMCSVNEKGTFPDNLGTNYSFNGQDMYLFAKLTFLKEFKRRHVYAQGD